MGVVDSRRGAPEELPQELADAFRDEPRARVLFDALSPAHRREYLTWVAEGRRAEARQRRAAQTVMRLLEDYA